MELNKWQLPGWRIEQKYNNRVLVGNWNEENRQFQRGNWKSNSTQRTDFKKYDGCFPDDQSRQYFALRTDGLDKKFIFSHSQAYKNYSNNLISLYDQQFNGREQKESKLPSIRSWDGNTLTWAPEKSDYPLQGPPTNFGLLEKTLARQAKQNRNDGAYSTTYGGSYKQLPKDSFVTTRFSTPRYLSSHLSPHNKIHKEIGLRNVTICTAQEHPPNKLLISVE